MRHTTGTTVLNAPAVGHRTHGDMGQAVAAQIAELALMAALAGQQGHVTRCRVAYLTPYMEFPVSAPLVTDYAGIWSFLQERIGAELEDAGISSMAGLLAPNSPIMVAFTRDMPGRSPGGLPVADGNDPALMTAVQENLMVDLLTCEDHHPEECELFSHKW